MDGTAHAPCLAGSSRPAVRFGAYGTARVPCYASSGGLMVPFGVVGTARAPCRAGSDGLVRGGRDCPQSVPCGFRAMDGPVWGGQDCPHSVPVWVVPSVPSAPNRTIRPPESARHLGIGLHELTWHDARAVPVVISALNQTVRPP